MLPWCLNSGSWCTQWVGVYPEGAVGDVDFPPGDDNGVFNGLGGNVNTEVGAVSIVRDLDIDWETLRILETKENIVVLGITDGI